MNVSGIVVQTAPASLASVIEQLNAVAGVDVHQIDQTGGRLVATIEAEDTGAEVSTLKAIKRLASVAVAELVYHRFDEDQSVIDAIPKDLDAMTGLASAAVPEYLNK